MLEGTKKLFPTEYKQFTEAMISAAEDGQLPVTLQLDETENITLQDIKDLFYEFNRDTSLNIGGTLFLCNDCGRLHLLIEVNYPDEEPTVLQ